VDFADAFNEEAKDATAERTLLAGVPRSIMAEKNQ